jgi:CHAT domain-containing protein
MFNGSEFLSLRHALGRFINKLPEIHQDADAATIGRKVTSVASECDPEEHLSLLLISVPMPLERENGESYDELEWVREESSAIQDIAKNLKKNVDVTVLDECISRRATGDNLRMLLDDARKQGRRYHIIHFSGHATYDDRMQTRSSLILEDEDFTTGELHTLLKKIEPVLFFANCCEGARIEAAIGHNVFDLASDILTTGCYFLGSRWSIRDSDAHLFATEFYRALLRDNESIGHSVRIARQNCFRAQNNSWASYIYYGDPRTAFKLID